MVLLILHLSFKFPHWTSEQASLNAPRKGAQSQMLLLSSVWKSVVMD